MSNIRTHIIAPLILAVMLLTGIQTALAASEVTGSLSSDGSSQTTESAVLSETNSNTGKLEGSVVGGRDEGASLALLDPSSWDVSTWIATFSLIALAIMGYLFWSRRVA